MNVVDNFSFIYLFIFFIPILYKIIEYRSNDILYSIIDIFITLGTLSVIVILRGLHNKAPLAS